MYNLLDNALKFSQPGDTIEVRGREDNRYVYLEVADTGPGIREEELPHVWEELYRGNSGRSVPGSGLGLAIVRAIAERHAGRRPLPAERVAEPWPQYSCLLKHLQADNGRAGIESVTGPSNCKN